MTEVEITNRETRTFLRSLPWGDLSGELVMDVGCGYGNMSTQCILERFPRASRVIAIDQSSECIQRSKVEFRNGIFKKAQFKKANVTVMRHLRRWEGKISKIVSAHCLSEIEKKERAFKVMYELLKPGGQAALLFTGRSQSDDVYAAMLQNPKWSPYFTVLFGYRDHEAKFTNLQESRQLLAYTGYNIANVRVGDNSEKQAPTHGPYNQ
ncbi:hypothetical protein AVEN_44474-1 [Araneus ventricosus]|uniref:Methyltransferase domain-containing protein n=1 Tax=Araneus ventricosus TaxID=182803 RepID=A0A4Y2P0X5_ARAVE|nr:hypothetical protein AVEN_44474-1 [Araneus ventricosus]